jgi:6-phosphogluconolactonase (cycloisomerase 2 family)
MKLRHFHRRLLTITLVFILLLPTLMTAAAGDPVHGNVAFVEVKYGNIFTYQASSVEISPDGQYLYLGATDVITVFKREVATGRLLRVQSLSDDGTMGLLYLDDMVISPDGKHLYTAGSFDDAVSVFIRNTSTGTLTFAFMMEDGYSADGLDGVMGLAISPDGNYLYAAGTEENAIARFSRN